MVAWHRSWRADLALRATGLLLGVIAYVAIARLVAMQVPPQTAGAGAYGLAALGFLGGSAGSAMVMLGRHLFDEIEVSERWRQRSMETPFHQPGDSVMITTEPVLLVVGCDTEGSWTVHESAGMLLGRFGSAAAAQRFAQAERRGRSAVSIATSAGMPRRIEGKLSLRPCAGRQSGYAGA